MIKRLIGYLINPYGVGNNLAARVADLERQVENMNSSSTMWNKHQDPLMWNENQSGKLPVKDTHELLDELLES